MPSMLRKGLSMLGEDDNIDACAGDLFEEYLYPTIFGDAEVFVLQTEEGTPLRVLYVGGGFQSATYVGENRFQPVFAYYRAIDLVFHAGRPIRRMLMIGGGGFSYPKHLLMSTDPIHRDISIDVVEIDPAIVEIARKHFDLDEVERLHGVQGTGRLGVIVADGAQVLRTSEPSAYDVIVNDSFDGAECTSALFSPEALSDTKRVLTAEGIYVANVVADDATEATPYANALHAVFAHVYLLLCPDEEFDGSSNNLLVASDIPLESPYQHGGSRQRRFQLRVV